MVYYDSLLLNLPSSHICITTFMLVLFYSPHKGAIVLEYVYSLVLDFDIYGKLNHFEPLVPVLSLSQ
jgi:hypothetical protein